MSRYFCLRETEEICTFLQNITPLGSEEISIFDAAGRVLAKDIKALFPLPKYPHSTRDGYAIRSKDTRSTSRNNTQTLCITGECRVGCEAKGSLNKGEAWRVYTGSGVPEGADCVVMQEHVELLSGKIVIHQPCNVGEYIIPRGADVPEKTRLGYSGQKLKAHDVALLSQFHQTILVRKVPVLGIIITGDEFCFEGRELGEDISPMQVSSKQGVLSTNFLLLQGIVTSVGAKAVHLGTVPDDEKALQQCLQESLPEGKNPCDVVVVVGGSSSGSRDFSNHAIISLPDCTMYGKDQSVSSGRPLVLARVKDVIIWGLPGYALSFFLATQVFLTPLLLRLMGLNKQFLLPCGEKNKQKSKRERSATQYSNNTIKARLKDSLPSYAEAFTHFPVILTQSSRGVLAQPVLQGTGKTLVLRDLSGWVTVPKQKKNRGLKKGDAVIVHLFV